MDRRCGDCRGKKEGCHAYLIMCHNNFSQLLKLLELLDDEKNDIYIHVDKKVKDFPRDSICGSVKHSKIFFVERVSVNWGGYSQIETELVLLKAAVKNGYDYYHLLSGADLPLKSQRFIHKFFSDNAGKEFIEVKGSLADESNFYDKISTYHFLSDVIGRKKGLLYILERVSLKIQHVLSVDRIKNEGETFFYGGNWFSITDSFAKYVIEKEPFIKKRFRWTLCADEIFIQTLVINSPYKDNIAGTNGRLVDWERVVDKKSGSPYTFVSEDFSLLTSSDLLFARKFDENIDNNIIEKLSLYVKSLC